MMGDGRKFTRRNRCRDCRWENHTHSWICLQTFAVRKLLRAFGFTTAARTLYFDASLNPTFAENGDIYVKGDDLQEEGGLSGNPITKEYA
jgi:hypothetical protein